MSPTTATTPANQKSRRPARIPPVDAPATATSATVVDDTGGRGSSSADLAVISLTYVTGSGKTGTYSAKRGLRGGKPMLPIIARARTLGLSLALATAGLGVVATVPASADPAATTWDVQVGAGNEFDTGLNRFYPSDITIHRGDTVSFAWGGFHTVTFNPPATMSVLDYFGPGGCSPGPLSSSTQFVSGVPFAPVDGVCPPPPSGPPTGPPPNFNLLIDVPAGTYHFQCMIHQFMHGSITVKSGALPRNNDDNKALAAAQITADNNRATALDARLTSRASHTSGEAIVGAGDKVVEFAKFYPTAITVHVGDELTFTDLDLHEPHTVSFGPIAGDPRDPSFGVFPSGPGTPGP